MKLIDLQKIPVLFAETNGPYFNDDRFDPWDINRNALNYKGAQPVIAHPPCQRWGRYWSGGPTAKVRRIKGDDNNCFAHSLWIVRTYGGVIEHPEASWAYKWFGLKTPPKKGGWIKADNFGGLACCVEQGHYGHKARKATWLYINKVKPIELIWGKAEGKVWIDQGCRSSLDRLKRKEIGTYRKQEVTAQERIATPLEFKELLYNLIKHSNL